MTTPLAPAQQRAYSGLIDALPRANVFVLSGSSGGGRTTVLHALHRAVGGRLLTLKDFVNAMRSRDPLAMEETLYQLVQDALLEHDCVLVDDLDVLYQVTAGCGSYPRSGFLEAPLNALATYAVQAGKKLILGGTGGQAAQARAYQFAVADFTPADYEFLCRAHLGELAGRLDFEKVFRFAPKLNAHHFKAACAWLRDGADLTTERFVEYLRTQYLASNVDLAEVQDISLRDLKGVDEVIESLEANIILPLENDELAKELGLKPKRGVLLAGPPGTGKTSVGRALAHRLKSKFFLLDGTIISGTARFYPQVHYLFEQAKQNAPSIIFIDDSDAIFESGEELGLYRYLLTVLDGLESASAGRVCVMLTAMDISHLPPALIRSGRIELWLEMRLPDEAARAAIMSRALASAAALAGSVDVGRLAAATDGFTGADLKRLVEDGKILFAHDKVRGIAPRPATEYFLGAAESVRQNKARYAEAEARARQQRPQRPVFFDAVTARDGA
ncbi:MAG: AAA family ATPase [Gemmataceae bacterium]